MNTLIWASEDEACIYQILHKILCILICRFKENIPPLVRTRQIYNLKYVLLILHLLITQVFRLNISGKTRHSCVCLSPSKNSISTLNITAKALLDVL